MFVLQQRRRTRHRLLRRALLVACCGLLSSCTRGAAERSRVIVLGVDGLDIRLLDRLVDAEELPHFARLYREGSVGPVRTAQAGIPPLSPRIWTSFATGQLPAVHGIRRFVYTDASGTKRLFTSDKRKTPAAWEIVSQAGRRVGVVNWWFTYPAEHVRGFVISDRYLENWARRSAKFYGGELERSAGNLVYPPELAKKLNGAVVDAKSGAITAEKAQAIDRNIFLLAYAAWKEYPVDLLMIYTRSLDELSHLRWNSHEPRGGEKFDRDEVVEFLRRYDVLLGELLDHMSPWDHLVLLSDHGFERNQRAKRPPGTHLTPESANAATIILHGPRIRAGFRLSGASVLDILPTILELADVPPARNMRGRVLRKAFVDDGGPLLKRVDAYQRSANRPLRAAATDADAATIERLRQLGYMH